MGSNLLGVQAMHFTSSVYVPLLNFFECIDFNEAKALQHNTAEQQKKEEFSQCSQECIL